MGTADFVAWMSQHCHVDPDRGQTTCRRCGRRVTYLTKHAVVRHGDPIEVMPVRNPRLAEEW